MNIIHRDNLDMEVAFSSSAKQPGHFTIRPKKTIRLILKRAAHFFYHVIAKFIQPITFRWRKYLLSGIHIELHHLIKQVDHLNALINDKTMISNVVQGAPGEMLINTLDGLIVCSSSDYAVSTCLMRSKVLEAGTRRVIQQSLSAGDTFIDIGAHLGLHTLAASHAMQHMGKIIAFEPCEENNRLINKTLQINEAGKITEVHQAAVSNSCGQQTLFLGKISGHHSLYSLDELADHAASEAQVNVVSLNSVIQSNQKIQLIKIDAEGAELAILEGASSVIAQNPHIALIVEFGPVHLNRTNITAQQWFSAFTDQGFVFKAINENTGNLADKTIDQLKQVESINLFFAKPDSIIWKKIKGLYEA